MRGITIVGIVLIILGIIGFIVGGISFTTKEEVADLGPLEIEKEEQHSFPIAPVASGVAVIAGVILVAVGSKKS